jgi:uncharacterized protein
MHLLRRLLASLLLLVSVHAQADFNDGVVALMAGKFDDALKIFVPLAENSDHAYSQYFLGRMYERGQGVTEDAKAAAEWYRKAAEKGVGDAQFRLGALYERGAGVPRDMEYAYGWYATAAHLGNRKAGEALAKTEGQLSPEERVQADKLARDLIGRFGVTPKSTSVQQ